MGLGILLGAGAQSFNRVYGQAKDRKAREERDKLLEAREAREEEKWGFEKGALEDAQRERDFDRQLDELGAAPQDVSPTIQPQVGASGAVNQTTPQVGESGAVVSPVVAQDKFVGDPAQQAAQGFRPVAAGVAPQQASSERGLGVNALGRSERRVRFPLEHAAPQKIIDREIARHARVKVGQARLKLQDAMRSGPQGLAEFYQEFTPYDDTVKFVGQGEDGSLMYEVTDANGTRPMPFKGGMREAVNFLRENISLEDFELAERNRLERLKVENAGRAGRVAEAELEERKKHGFFKAEADATRSRGDASRAAAEHSRAAAKNEKTPKELVIMDDLIRRGIAVDQNDAWEKLQTGKGRNVSTVAASLLASQNPRYMGANGRTLAMQDAAAITGGAAPQQPAPRSMALKPRDDGSFDYIPR